MQCHIMCTVSSDRFCCREKKLNGVASHLGLLMYNVTCNNTACGLSCWKRFFPKTQASKADRYRTWNVFSRPGAPNAPIWAQDL